ncbi:MAG: T9SS type A sorting domain-containing protein, partial [Bacteroidia bacterium]|nr:T9SS type A sorting domain-containing protein [Bacteroidia bacterium]
YVNPVAVPGIVDIDGDGDLDVLTFSATGVLIQWHKNMSMENYNKPDSLEFQLQEECWGKVAESSCTANLSYSYCMQSSSAFAQVQGLAGKELHAGSCLTCLDSDGDLDMDLIIGDILCKTTQYMHNVGTQSAALFGDTTKMYPNYPGKGNTTQPYMNSFPCAYIVDVDNDQKQDLIVAPNSLSSENYKSVWLYRNTSQTSTVNFQFVKNNFLQDEMIDVGQNSLPVLLDYDADGKKDLLIGNYGYYQGNTTSARLTLYRNTGSNSQPSFSLVTRDYASLAQYSLSGIMPSVGDIDNDNDLDICIGVTSGQIHWLENTGGQGNPCNFSVFKNNPFGFTTVSSGAIPQLFDLDTDGKLDLLIGMQNGNIAFYKNTGTLTTQNVLAPSFSLVTNTLGNIDVKSDPLVYGYEGDAAPFFYNDNGIKLMVGSITGALAYYTVPSNILDPYNLINAQVNGYNEGGQSTVCYEDINGDGIRDMFIGNSGGGLKFYSSKSMYVGLKDINNERILNLITFFPNPLNEKLNIRIEEFEFSNASIHVNNLLGQELMKQSIPGNTFQMDVSGLAPGVYLAKIYIEYAGRQVSLTKKLIKE